jgi:hypothetical protein
MVHCNPEAPGFMPGVRRSFPLDKPAGLLFFLLFLGFTFFFVFATHRATGFIRF